MRSVNGQSLACLLIAMTAVVLPAARAGNFPPPAVPDNTRPPLLGQVGIDQKLGAQVPADLALVDEDGNAVRFGDVLRGRPAVLSLVYYGCPTLCTVVLNNQMRTYSALPLTMGTDFDVISVSFDPRETAELARTKKREYVRKFGRNGVAANWRFLTASPESIKRLTETVGFRYAWDERSAQFVHPGGVMVLMPDGKVARYFFGIDYEPKDLRLALVEAGQGKVGTLTDQIMLYCFHYDPTTGKYGWAVMRALRVGGVLTILGLVGGIAWMLRKEKAEGRSQKAENGLGPTLPSSL